MDEEDREFGTEDIFLIGGAIPSWAPHSSYGSFSCEGCLQGVFVGDRAKIICKECGAVIRTVPAEDLNQKLMDMELAVDLSVENVRALWPGKPVSRVFRDAQIHMSVLQKDYSNRLIEESIGMATQSYDAGRNLFFLDLHGVLKRDAARVLRKRVEECAFMEIVWRPDHLPYERQTKNRLFTQNDAWSSCVGTGILSAKHADHVGIVVPDLDAAVRCFEDALGAQLLWRVGPFQKTPTGVPITSVILAMLRLGPNLNVELQAFEAEQQVKRMPSNVDWGATHIAFFVDDMQAAASSLANHGGELLHGPIETAGDEKAGEQIWYFETPWGSLMEILWRPDHLPYEKTTPNRLVQQ